MSQYRAVPKSYIPNPLFLTDNNGNGEVMAIGIEEWIERAKAGDPEAFEPVIRMTQQKLYRYCRFVLMDNQEAEDAVQDILFKAYRHLGSYRGGNAMSWLYKIAATHCATLLRKKGRRERLMSMLSAMSGGTEKSAEQAFADSAGVRLDWLGRLSPAEREIVVLRVLADMPFEEIARVAGIRPAAARKRYERAKSKLQQNYSKVREVVYHERGYEC